MVKPQTAGAPWQAIVDSRAVLTAVQGLGSRFHQVVSPRAAAQTTGWRLAAALGATVDVAKAHVLARDDRFRLGSRLLLDAADLALWCVAAGDDTDTSEDAVIPGAALATEAGARLGPIGLAVPVANAAVAAAVRRARGHRLRLEQFSWQLMGTGGGWAVQVLAERRRRRLDAKHQADLAARAQQAELAGLHDVIAEHEGPIDILQRASVLIDLGAPTTDERRDIVGAVKAAVAEAVRARATYLRDSLLVWQARRNLEPDLARLVKVEVGPSDGMVLLSGTQAGTLHAALDSLDLVGTVTVSLADSASARRPFGPRELLVNERRVLVPEAEGDSWTFDALPAALVLDVGWLSQPTGGHREAVPWSATALPMVIALGAAAWSARRAGRAGATPPGPALTASLGITLLYTVLASRTMRHSHTEAGVSRFPWVMALQGYELVRGITAEQLSGRERAAGLAGTALTMLAGWALSPPPRSLRALVAELGWVAGFDLFAARLRAATSDAADKVSAAMAVHDADVLDAAYERGRQQAEQLTAAALAQTRLALDARATHLPPDLEGEARRRLDQVAPLLPTE